MSLQLRGWFLVFFVSVLVDVVCVLSSNVTCPQEQDENQCGLLYDNPSDQFTTCISAGLLMNEYYNNRTKEFDTAGYWNNANSLGCFI